SGQLGCVDCKKKCIQKINEFLSPIREKRNYYEKNTNEVIDILVDGEKRAKEVARQTMDEVHNKMKFG
ncbi:MAG: tryptophan--tRNA ligase, partial [Ignavibacteriales bacterium]|nr:tryptophan--tRNA ligase [Ignavibacteriales bacterium]